MNLAVINLVENGTMDKKDFIVTENYNLRLKGLGGEKIANDLKNYEHMRPNMIYEL